MRAPQAIRSKWEKFMGETYALLMKTETTELVSLLDEDIPGPLKEHLQYRIAAELSYRASREPIDCLQHKKQLKDCIYSHVRSPQNANPHSNPRHPRMAR